MKINQANISPIYKQSFGQKQVTAPISAEKTQAEALPAAPNQKDFNVNTPIAYTKISEFSIPGLKDKASVYKLANGQKVVVMPKEGPIVVQSFFNVGSLNEPDNIRGISHYIEHNLFNGSRDLAPGEFTKQVDLLGGYTNASTGCDQTNYRVIAWKNDENYLDRMLKIHSSQIQYPTFTPAMLEKEKGPVTSEISMYSDMDSNILTNVTMKKLFGLESSSQDMVAGSIDKIRNLTEKDVRNYYDTWYTPDNTYTVITGDVSPDNAISTAAKYFTKPPSSMQQNRLIPELKPIDKTVRTDIKHPNCTSTKISMGFIGPENNNSKDKIAVELINAILNEKKFMYALDPYQSVAGIFQERIANTPDAKRSISVMASTNEQNSEIVLQELFNTISAMKKNPPTVEEIEITKEKLKLSREESLEYSEAVNNIIGNAMLNGDTDSVTNYNALIDSLTREDIINALNKYYTLDKAAVTLVHPQNTTDQSIVENYKKLHTKPQQPKAIGFKGHLATKYADKLYADVETYRLQNNVEVNIKPSTSDISTFILNYSIPKSLDVSKCELDILNEMLNRGTISKDLRTFADEKDKNNITSGVVAKDDFIIFRATTNSKHLKDGLNLVLENLQQPRLTQEEFEAAKKKVYDNYVYSEKSASDKLQRELYPQLKIAQTNEEEINTLQNVNLARIQSIYNTLISNSQITATMMAPTTQNPALKDDFINTVGTRLVSQAHFTPRLDNTYSPNTKPVILTQEDNRAQAEIIQAYKYKVTGNVNDDVKTEVLATILGGGMTSRLFSDLREKQHLAYHVGASQSGLGNTGIMKLSIGTTTDDPNDPINTHANIKKSLDGFKKHVDLLKTTKVSEEELENAKRSLKNDYLNSLETSDNKVCAISAYHASPYGKDYDKKYLEALDKITAEDIQSAAQYVFENPPITSILASKKTLDNMNIQ